MSLTNSFFIHLPLWAVFENLDEIVKGRHNIEIFVSSKALDEFKRRDLQYLRSTFKRYGISVIGHGPFLDLNPGSFDAKIKMTTRERYLKALEFCQDLGIEHIVLHHNFDPRRHGFDFEGWLREATNTFMEVGEVAEGMGILIAIENGFEGGPNLLKTLLSNISLQNIFWCFDVGHANVASRIPMEHWFSSLKGYISEIHLHDNFGDVDEHLALGEGNIDFSNVRKLLSSLKKMPLITIEAHTKETIQKSIHFLKEGGWISQ